MVKCWLFEVVLLSLTGWAADQTIPIPQGGQKDAAIVLSASEIKTEPVLWVQADPTQVEVTVIGPDGRRWTRANTIADSPLQVELADRQRGSSDEASLVDFIGSNGTLIGWSTSAVAGTYNVQLSGKKLSAPKDVLVQRTTIAEFSKQLEANADRRQNDVFASMLRERPGKRRRATCHGSHLYGLRVLREPEPLICAPGGLIRRHAVVVL